MSNASLKAAFGLDEEWSELHRRRLVGLLRQFRLPEPVTADLLEAVAAEQRGQPVNDPPPKVVEPRQQEEDGETLVRPPESRLVISEEPPTQTSECDLSAEALRQRRSREYQRKGLRAVRPSLYVDDDDIGSLVQQRILPMRVTEDDRVLSDEISRLIRRLAWGD